MTRVKAVMIASGAHPYWTEPPILDATYRKEGCGCDVVGNGTIPHPLAAKLCKLHAAALKLLEALKEVTDSLREDPGASLPTDVREMVERAIAEAGETP